MEKNGNLYGRVRRGSYLSINIDDIEFPEDFGEISNDGNGIYFDDSGAYTETPPAASIEAETIAASEQHTVKDQGCPPSKKKIASKNSDGETTCELLNSPPESSVSHPIRGTIGKYFVVIVLSFICLFLLILNSLFSKTDKQNRSDGGQININSGSPQKKTANPGLFQFFVSRKTQQK